MTPDAIAHALAGYVPGPDERTHLERMQTLLASSGSGLARDAFEPGHFTASALVVGPGAREVALIFHAKLHRWLQPGGHLEDADESPLAAALREVHEEIGLGPKQLHVGVLFDLDIHVIPARPQKGEPAHEHFDLRFRFDAKERWPLRPATDAVDARWVPIDEVEHLESDASVRRMLAKLSAPEYLGGPQVPMRTRCSSGWSGL